jgi:hypothetical protein
MITLGLWQSNGQSSKRIQVCNLGTISLERIAPGTYLRKMRHGGLSQDSQSNHKRSSHSSLNSHRLRISLGSL